MKIAQEELLKSRKKNKTLYGRRAKRREFQEGDKVLLLLLTNTNKLLMQWKGPYEIMSRCGKGNDYRVAVNKKVKTSLEKITAFKWKLNLWLKRVPKSSFDQFAKFNKLRKGMQVEKHVRYLSTLKII